MSIRNILVAFNGSDSAIAALNYAASSARAGTAHVTALLAHSAHQIVNSRDAWVPPKARQIIEEANADIIHRIRATFDGLRDELDLGERLHFIDAAGRVDNVLSEFARGFDIIVVGRDRTGDVDEHVAIHPDKIALMSGRPVLVIPGAVPTDEPSRTHAALAWDGNRASARALSDGLQLLDDRGRVSVLTVGDEPLPRPVGELLTHLERHGVEARHEPLAADGGVAAALLDYCRTQHPGILVMGAYEHSKFREDFLGGVTARVLRHAQVPVLLSH